MSLLVDLAGSVLLAILPSEVTELHLNLDRGEHPAVREGDAVPEGRVVADGVHLAHRLARHQVDMIESAVLDHGQDE